MVRVKVMCYLVIMVRVQVGMCYLVIMVRAGMCY